MNFFVALMNFALGTISLYFCIVSFSDGYIPDSLVFLVISLGSMLNLIYSLLYKLESKLFKWFTLFVNTGFVVWGSSIVIPELLGNMRYFGKWDKYYSIITCVFFVSSIWVLYNQSLLNLWIEKQRRNLTDNIPKASSPSN